MLKKIDRIFIIEGSWIYIWKIIILVNEEPYNYFHGIITKKNSHQLQMVKRNISTWKISSGVLLFDTTNNHHCSIVYDYNSTSNKVDGIGSPKVWLYANAIPLVEYFHTQSAHPTSFHIILRTICNDIGEWQWYRYWL